mmetsp:Transcript_58139/g.168483  ORF Transcript_58139/g.168483 Transcript_58139/m.168483 type:complete len:317 (-) Transcript_58139:331-1281(-)
MTRQYQTSASSRERNRIHARKTRQRKKEQMKTLTARADELRSEQIRLKQCINEKNTASILVGLFTAADNGGEQRVEDPRVEALLRRPAEEIPDAAKLPELPALILPGQHNSKKHKVPGTLPKQELPDDGIDYELLGKDRSKCTAAELDQIRRERNRMHAKRTRDRKRLFMEEMAEMCKTLEDENEILRRHLHSLNNTGKEEYAGPVISPALSSQQPEVSPSDLTIPNSAMRRADKEAKDKKPPVSEHGVTYDQINTLLEAASTFSSSAVSDSSQEGGSDADHHEERHYKRRRLNGEQRSISVPNSITTSSPTAVGC